MPRQSKLKPVSVGERLRKATPWFEKGAEKAKDGAAEKRRVEFRVKGPALKPDELIRIGDELEEIQRKLNPLQVRHEELSAALLAHWGHTGIEEIKSKLGKTLFSTSTRLTVNSDAIRRSLTETQWQMITERRPNAQLLLALGGRDEGIRSIIIKAIKASASISVTPPSSRRPKSGQPEEENEE